MLVAVACGGGPAPGSPGEEMPTSDPPREAGPRVPPADDYVRRPLAIDDATRARVAEAFGPPDSVLARPVQNRHVPTQTDTMVALIYPDARFEFYAVTGGRDLLSHAAVESNRYLRYPRPGIGTPAASLLRWFGEPDRRTADAYVYYCRACIGAEEPVVFYIYDGVVRRIEVFKYVD